MIKKFSEFVAESKQDDHHAEAKRIVMNHSSKETQSGHPDNYDEAGSSQHIGSVNRHKVDKLHSALKAAGFEHKGVVAHGGHRYEKGKTHVDVSSKPERDETGYLTKHNPTHHEASVFTSRK